jgi:regulator of RNase E activity RraA
VKVGGLWVKPGDLVHADHHGVVSVPPDVVERLPEAVAAVEADERKIIGLCQSRDFSVDRLKELYRQIRPGTY